MRNVDVEDLLAELLSAVFEIVGEFLLQLIFELAGEALRALIDGGGKQTSPVVSAIGLIFGGAVAGLLSAWLFPHRITTRVVLPGVSLLLAPLATGSAMHFVGNRLRRLEREPSNLATFWGGAVFAFAMALIRWWLVGLPR